MFGVVLPCLPGFLTLPRDLHLSDFSQQPLNTQNCEPWRSVVAFMAGDHISG
jgi:hypothetical protein